MPYISPVRARNSARLGALLCAPEETGETSARGENGFESPQLHTVRLSQAICASSVLAQRRADAVCACSRRACKLGCVARRAIRPALDPDLVAAPPLGTWAYAEDAADASTDHVSGLRLRSPDARRCEVAFDTLPRVGMEVVEMARERLASLLSVREQGTPLVNIAEKHWEDYAAPASPNWEWRERG